MNKKDIVLIFVTIFFIIPISVKASSLNISLNCPTSINKNSYFNCKVHEVSSDGPIVNFQAEVSYTNGISCDSFSSDALESSYVNNKIITNYESEYLLSNRDIGSINCFMSNVNNTQTVTLDNVNVNVKNGQTIQESVNVNPVFIRPVSDDATLSNLYVNNGNISPSFSSNIYEYSVTVFSSKITIYGNASSQYAKVNGLGVKNLNYGENDVNVTVVAEAGNYITYVLKINRVDNRNSDCGLSNLSVSYGSINFNTNVTNYYVNLASNVESNTITAFANNNKATIKYSPSKTVYLNYGDTKVINVIVTAENGNSKTYTITFTRADGRSTNNFLANLNVDNYYLNFSNLRTSYVLEVENSVTSVNISGNVEDSRSKVIGLGNTNLDVGSNIKTIVVTSESGVTRTYVLTIIRKDVTGNSLPLSNNNYLSNLSIEGIEFNFDKNNLNYVLGVINDINNIKIDYTKEDESSVVVIDGNTNLVQNENYIKVIVTALDSSQRIYTIIINKYDANIIETSDLEVINNKINDSNGEINILTNNRIKLDETILNNLKLNNKNILLNIMNENKGLIYSLYISGANVNDEQEFDSNIEIIDNDNNLKNILKSSYLLIKHNGKYINDTLLKLLVNNYFANNTILYLYGYENGVLIPLDNNSLVKNGYVSFNLGEYDSYVISDKQVNDLQNNILNEKKKNMSLIILVPMLFIGSGLFYFKKRKNKLSK